MDFNPSKPAASITGLKFLSVKSHVLGGKCQLPLGGPFGLLVTSYATWMEKYSPKAEGSILAGFPLLGEFPSYYQSSKVISS